MPIVLDHEKLYVQQIISVGVWIVNTHREQSLLVCWKIELNNSSSFTKFSIFASAFVDLLLQSNNGTLQI